MVWLQTSSTTQVSVRSQQNSCLENNYFFCVPKALRSYSLIHNIKKLLLFKLKFNRKT